ncbi:hypothetical protein ACWDA9_03600, partial [Streptomyces sp. NPDC001193]
DMFCSGHVQLSDGRVLVIPEPAGGPGRVFVAENYALLAAVRGRRLPRRSPAEGRASVPAPARAGEAGAGHGRTGGERPGPVRVAPRAERGRVEAAWFAADDPMPFLAMLAAFLGRGAGKGVRALRGVPAHGRRTARAVVRAPRQRARGLTPSQTPATPAASAEPDELVTR